MEGVFSSLLSTRQFPNVFTRVQTVLALHDAGKRAEAFRTVQRFT